MFESVRPIETVHGSLLMGIEWGFTILFTIDYLVRLWCSPRPLRYVFSFFGIVDLCGVIPTYLWFLQERHYLVAVRFLRMLRIFRILKLSSCLAEYSFLTTALKASRRRLAVFLFVVLTLVVVLGSLMYATERQEDSGFTSIPASIYWAIVTITTVGYGDIAPQTIAGRTIASVLMILGYSIIVVPTGIVSVEMAQVAKDGKQEGVARCPHCAASGHAQEAAFCNRCGASLLPGSSA